MIILTNICQNLCKKLVEKENSECSICFNKIIDCNILYPCGHYELCSYCTTKITNCPLCRENIDKIIPYTLDKNCIQKSHEKKHKFSTWW